MVDLVDAPTLRGAIARRFAQYGLAPPTDLALVFDARDASKLDRSTAFERFEVSPQGTLHSDLVIFSIRAWAHDRMTDAWEIPVLVR